MCSSFGVILIMMDFYKTLICLQILTSTFYMLPLWSVHDIKCFSDSADYIAVMNVCLIYPSLVMSIFVSGNMRFDGRLKETVSELKWYIFSFTSVY